VASDTFGKVAAQSPALRFWPQIYGLYEDQLPPLPDLVITSGSIHDARGTDDMVAILTARGYDLAYLQTHQGHSWGQWRAWVDDILMRLIGPP
jgi:enterochelin esterase family protein